MNVIFVWIVGTLLHFTHDWFPNSTVFTVVSAVNESTWEHLKLVFFPMLVVTVVGYFYNRDVSNFLFARLVGVLVAMSFIVVFFYTYTGVVGTNFAVLDIGSFFVAVVLGELAVRKVIASGVSSFGSGLAAMIWVLIFICFVVFTYFPPEIGLFADPLFK